MITIDTSGIVAALNPADREHARVLRALAVERGPIVIPMSILSEITYMIESGLTQRVLDQFLSEIDGGLYTLDCGEEDLPRIRELIRRYADLPLGFADAAVIACAERRGGRVLTLDLRHFGVVAREGRIVLVPE